MTLEVGWTSCVSCWVGGCIVFLWAFILVSVIILTDVVRVGNVYLEIFKVLYRIGSIIFRQSSGRACHASGRGGSSVDDQKSVPSSLQGLGLA
jgi:hypothetical protein